MAGPFLAIDVQYDQRARVAAVGFDAWTAAEPNFEHAFEMGPVREYRPGAFFERELPCIERMLTVVLTRFVPHTIIVDGYVDLGTRPGLGRYVQQVGGGAVVVGVAKSSYGAAPSIVVLRGDSKRPLYVTAAGMDELRAARHVQAMHGDYRIPTLLRRVDALARGNG